MLQLTLLNLPRGILFNRASAFPLVRLRRTGIPRELQQSMNTLPFESCFSRAAGSFKLYPVTGGWLYYFIRFYDFCDIYLRAQRVLDADGHCKATGFSFTSVGVENLGMTLGTKPGNFDMLSE